MNRSTDIAATIPPPSTPKPKAPRAGEHPDFPSVLPGTEIVVAQCCPAFVRRLLSGSRNPNLRRVAAVGHPNGYTISTGDFCLLGHLAARMGEIDDPGFELEKKTILRTFKFTSDRSCETFPDPGIGFSLTDELANRAALVYPAFKASPEWRTWCDAALIRHQKKPAVDRDVFLFSEFRKERPDAVLALARDKAEKEAKDKADEYAAHLEKLRRARAIRMQLEAQGVDVKTIAFARKHVDEIPPDASADEIRAAHEAAENA